MWSWSDPSSPSTLCCSGTGLMVMLWNSWNTLGPVRERKNLVCAKSWEHVGDIPLLSTYLLIFPSDTLLLYQAACPAHPLIPIELLQVAKLCPKSWCFPYHIFYCWTCYRHQFGLEFNSSGLPEVPNMPQLDMPFYKVVISLAVFLWKGKDVFSLLFFSLLHLYQDLIEEMENASW